MILILCDYPSGKVVSDNVYSAVVKSQFSQWEQSKQCRLNSHLLRDSRQAGLEFFL